MPRRSRAGTSIKRSWDVKRLGQAIKAQGLDLRHWVSYGTVASVTGEDGKPNFTDPNAILITPAGVEIDVVLEPSGYPCTCKYGIQAGTVYICTPVKPGDQVLVTIPDGDVSMVPVAVKVVSGSSDPIPTEDDGTPVFKNDRCLIFAKGVPIDLRTDGGARALLSGNEVIMNDGDRGVARKEDAVVATLSGKPPPAPESANGIYGLAAQLLATGVFLPNPSPPPPSLLPDFGIDGEITEASDTVKAGG